MDPQQDATISLPRLDETAIPVPYSELNYIQRAYVDWKAMSGLITDDNGMKKMSLTALAEFLHVERSTIYRAMEKVPNMWDLINDQRKELAPRSRLARMHEIWYLSALKPGGEGFRDRQLWLANFDPDFRMPTEKVQHEVGDGMADALNVARERRLKSQTIVEGEVVDGSPQP